MIDYAYESLFEQNSVDKQYEIEVYDDTTTVETIITNTELFSEQFEFNHPLCSENTLRYGACEAGCVIFTVVNTVGTLKGKRLEIYVTPAGGTRLQIGEFYVDKDELSDDRLTRKITAYDILYKIINTDMLEWYSELGLPLTMKAFRDAFFDYFGVEQVEADLCNDLMPITETMIAEQLSGLEVLSCILSGNAALGTINNEGKFKYVTFDSYDTKAYGTQYKQRSLVYEDYEVQPITSLKFYSNNDLEIVVTDTTTTTGFDDNQYIIEDNFLFYDKLEEDLTPFVQNIFDVMIQTPYFRPLKAQVYGDYCVELGDMITFTTPAGDTFSTLVLEKTTKGLISITDEYETLGTEYYEYDLNGGNSQIRRIWNNTLVLIEEVANARCYVYAQRNNNAFTITDSGPVTIVNIALATTDATIPIFLATIPLTMSLDGTITFRYFLDDEEINENDTDTIYLTKGEQFVTISTFFELDANVRKRFTVTAQAGYRESVERQQTAKILSIKDWIDNQSISVETSGGVTTATFDYDYVEQDVDDTPPVITIGKGEIRAEVFASGLASKQPWDGTIKITDEVAPSFVLNENTFAGNVTDSVNLLVINTTSISLSDSADNWNLNEINVISVSDSVLAETHTDSYPRLLEDNTQRFTEDDVARNTEGD